MNKQDCEKKVEALIESMWDKAAGNEEGDCDECKYFNCWQEHHPYGSTTAAERLCECQVPNAKDCPVVEQLVAEMYQKVVYVEKKP